MCIRDNHYWQSMVLPSSIEKGLWVSNAVVVPRINTMNNQSSITKMASYPSDSDKFVMRTMHIACHGASGMGNGYKKSLCFCLEVWFTCHFPKPSHSGLYPPICTANGTSLTPLYDGFFFACKY